MERGLEGFVDGEGIGGLCGCMERGLEGFVARGWRGDWRALWMERGLEGFVDGEGIGGLCG